MATKVTGWFPHDIDTIDDVDVQLLIHELGPQAYGIWWRIVEVLHKHGGAVDWSRLHFIVDRSLGISDDDLGTLCSERVLIECQQLGLLNREGDVVTSDRVMRNLDYRQKVSEKRSQAGRKGGLSKSQANAKQVPSKPEAKRSTLTVTDTYTEDKSTHSKKSVCAFAPPTIDEVTEYFAERGAPEHLAQNYHDHYEAVGWKVGSKKMKDWRAAARRWMPKGPTSQDVGTFALDRWPDRIDGTNPEMSYAKDFYRHYQKQGWKLGNGNPITDWKTALVEWVENKMRGL